MAARVALYAEVDANLIDGSSIWLQSVALTLAERSEVTVLLRVPERREVITAPLHAHPRITVLQPDIEPADVRVLPPRCAVERFDWLDAESPFDVLLLRGDGAAEAALEHERLLPRLWLYHLPPAGLGPEDDAERLRRWSVAGRVLTQTSELRDAAVAAVPELAGRCDVLPPILDDAEAAPAKRARGPRRLVYTGKIAPGYGFEAMLALFARFREREPRAELHVAGDKVHDPPGDPGFRERAGRALAETPGLVHHGALARADVGTLLRRCDVAFALRTDELAGSRELSTKLLEYGAAGCPPLVGRTPVHERLLGSDYPLFAETVDEALARLEAAVADPAVLGEAARRAGAAAEGHRRSAVAAGLELPSAGPSPDVAAGPRVLVATHSPAFLGPLTAHLAARGCEVRGDTWLRHGVHVADVSRRGSEWASTILCEWCLGNAVWHAERRREDQRLVVRLHRMEADTAYPAQLQLDGVDALVFVSEHMRDRACERFGWPRDERLHVIPNSVDLALLDRPKLPGAEFTLGVVGYAPAFKRLDRVLDILERVRAVDDRFRLRCKGRPPWELPGLLDRAHDRAFFEEAFDRIRRSPLLRDAVLFEPHGDDVADFLAGVGWIVSASDDEGHAVGLAEGMAARCAPVVIDRPGARRQYRREWVHGDAESAGVAVLASHAAGRRRDEGEAAREHAAQWSWTSLAPAWDAVLGLGAGES